MKVVVAAIALALSACSSAFATPITYSVSDTAMKQSAAGTITTDGTKGTLSLANILDFDFILSNSTTSTEVSKANGGTIDVEGNDLSANANKLFFDFSDTGFAGLAIYDALGNNVLCIGTPQSCYTSYPDNIVIVVNGNFTQKNVAATNHAIGNVVTTAATPEPSSFLLLGTGALGAFTTLRRRILAR